MRFLKFADADSAHGSTSSLRTESIIEPFALSPEHVEGSKGEWPLMQRILMQVAVATSAAIFLSGCSTAGYYAHLAGGEYDLLSRRLPIDEVIADPQTSDRLRERLKLARQAREFASAQLKLPRNASYTLYADVGRPFVMWNVFAAPEFSLSPVLNCLPIAGCVAYRGYYDRKHAETLAESLRAKGDETYIGGVPAYSTLGWFDDPILNTMMRWDDDELDGTIFHELAHQQLYLKGETAFNESFATFVQREGLRQWRASRGLPVEATRNEQREDQFVQLVLDARKRLEQVYANHLPPDAMRELKQAEFDRLKQNYVQLRDTQWQGDKAYDGWMNEPMNNAKLLPFGLYHQWVPAFGMLFEQAHGDWTAFYAAAKKLADESAGEREATLKSLAAGTPA
jgi:predicted aminopeptidase